MSEAPERIWAGDFDHRDNGHCVSGSRSVSTYTQYLRADIAASQVAEALRGNRYAQLEAIAREELSEAQATVVAAWNAFGGHVADDYDETKDVALVAGGDLAEQIAELSNQRNAAEAERDRWKGEYLNACRDAASFSDDLVKAEAERDRLAAEVTLLRAVARRYLDVTQEYFSDAEYDRNGCLAEAAAKLVVLLYSETARAALASVKE